jgi:glycosyltransferase involved in cell wall biosynthesis
MRLSFVIPAYNEEACLPACLESVLEQTRHLSVSVEIIVVNNASTDQTRAVALSHPGVKVVDEPRKGLTYARQAGFVASTGDLVANVDSDSRLTPGWVQTVLTSFEEDPQLIALSGPLKYEGLALWQEIGAQLFYCLGFIVYVVNRYVLRVGSMVQGGNFVLRRDALQEIGGFNLDIAFYGEDTDIARRLNRLGKVKFTFDLRMFSSSRRLRAEGVWTIAARYGVNYLWTIFRKRPFTEEYIDIRERKVVGQLEG